MEDEKSTVGVWISTERNGHLDMLPEIHVRAMHCRDGENSPLNGGISFTSSAECLNDLEMLASPGSRGDWISLRAHYYDVFRIETRRAKAMAKMLEKIDRVRTRANATEAGDVFMAFCAAIDAKWVAVHADDKPSSWHYDANWRWLTLADGREHFRREVQAALAEVKERQPIAA